MANMRIATAARQAAGDAVVDRIDAGSGAGTIEIRSGTQPATANDAATGTLLATLTFDDPAFGAMNASGVATAGPITGDTTADATGTASWARIKDSDAATVFDCDVTATGGGGTIQLNTVAIQAGAAVNITSFTISMPDGT